MKIVVDAFGGDNAPLEIIKGTILAKQEFGEDYVLTGPISEIKACADQNGLSLDGIELVEAPTIMDMHDEAKLVVKQKADSSMGVGLRLVADGNADAFVTAGPTGATLMGATLLIKRIKGVKRPALGAVMPGKGDNNFILMDCGANVECRPEMLDQFAVLGSIYMKKLYGVENPRVGLANNGVEDSKGAPLQVEAYQLLKKNPNINFVGNAEGRDIPLGQFDVVVADGFTGNMVLKASEGMILMVMSFLKKMFTATIFTKIAAALMKQQLKLLKDRYSAEKVGGAPFIGLNKPVVKAHGSANANAFKNAIGQAIKWSRSGMIEEIEQALQK